MDELELGATGSLFTLLVRIDPGLRAGLLCSCVRRGLIGSCLTPWELLLFGPLARGLDTLTSPGANVGEDRWLDGYTKEEFTLLSVGGK